MDLYGFAITFKEFPGNKNKYSMEYPKILYLFYKGQKIHPHKAKKKRSHCEIIKIWFGDFL